MVWWIWLTTMIWIGPSAHAWQPSGAPRPGHSRPCHPQLWAKAYLDERSPVRRWQSLQRQVVECAAEAREGQPQGPAAETWLERLEWTPLPSKTVKFQGRQGQSLEGSLFLQPGTNPRPMVVIGCDFDCDPRTNAWVKTLVMQLFEEGETHLFIVNSPELRALDTAEWLAGGLKYGHDLLEAGFWLQFVFQERRRISSAHVLGKGWAGKATLDALLFSEHNPIADGRKVFHSAVALCPAVKLAPVLTALDTPTTAPAATMKDQVENVLVQLKNRHPTWSDWLRDWQPHLPLMEKWLFASLAQAEKFFWLKPFRDQPPKTPAAWLDANDFVYQSLGIKTMSWAVGSTEDPRFPAELHWQPLADQHRDRTKSNLFVTGLEDSTSCAWAASHGWSFAGHLIRTLVLQEAYEIWPRTHGERIEWTLGSPALAANEIHLDQEWMVTDKILLKFVIAQQISGKIDTTREVLWSIPASALPANLSPLDLSEPRRTTRLLNAWLRLYGKSEPLVQSAQSAVHLEFRK
jgi:hypothetical protein